MRRKIIVLLLTAAMTAGLFGCGSQRQTTSKDIAEEREQSNNSEIFIDEKMAAEEGTNGSATKESEESIDVDSYKSSVSFGSNEAVGYDGFKYLEEQMISTSDISSENDVSYSVYVPVSDDILLSEYSAGSSFMGVYFMVNLEPDHMGYKTKDYALKEGLENFVNKEWGFLDYKRNYYAASVGEVKQISDNMAVCEISWVQLIHRADSDDEVEFCPIYLIYAVQDMGDGIIALMETTVIGSETSDETQTVLDELSSFYGFEIGWNSSFADTKMTEFESSDEYRPDAFDLYYMSFMLPDGWEMDIASSSPTDNGYVFAPGGNMRASAIAIALTHQVSTEDVIKKLLNEDTAEEYVKSGLFDNEDIPIQDITISDIGETFMGRTVEVIIKFADGLGVDTMFVYMSQGTYDVYGICLISFDGASEADLQSGQEAIDMLFETGRL